MKWLLKLYTNRGIRVGSRVNTPYGMATVMSGCLHVRLDKPHRASNGTMNDGMSVQISSLS